MKQFLLGVSLLLFSVSLLALTADAQTKPHSLTVGEGCIDPIGFHDATPSLSWQLPDGVKKQSAYHVEAFDAATKDGATKDAATKDASQEMASIWDSGWVDSDQSVFVPLGGSALKSRQQVLWRVRYKDEAGNKSQWSDFAKLELGLLSKDQWSAKWIRPAAAAPADTEKVAKLKHQFELDGSIKQARLYVAARGIFEITLNGERVGNDFFANGQTSYNNRLDSVTYDITDQLTAGTNSIESLLGYGWYAGRFGWKGERQVFGQYPELLVQLEVTYADGRTERIVSDQNWQATIEGPIVSSSIYDGEHVDARLDWSNFQPVIASDDLGSARIVPKPFATVVATEVLETKQITTPEPNRFVFDLEQNMVGWAKLNIPVQKDQTITLRFAEMLNADGTIHTDNYRSAKSTDSYTAAETGGLQWQPKFTFHGFRFVELSGFADDVTPEKDWVTGVVLHTELEKIGSFESSHPKLNRLQQNITWGQRGNFLDIPTDCPQRDERAGWTGDAQAFAPTSLFNYDCRSFWKSWLDSMRDDQFENGSIPFVVPDITGKGGSPGWVDAATIIPWELYVRTGDIEVLSENYAMMEKLVAWYRSRLKNGLLPKVKGFGDWLQPYAKDNRGDTPQPLIALAFYGRSCQLLAKTAAVLGREDDAKKYSDELDSIRNSFANHYFDAAGKIQNAAETQTGYLLALQFELIPAAMRVPATQNLVRLIEAADGHLRTGFLGTPYLVSMLDEMGETELAFSLLFKESYPSWFYSINQGATTMWERWNSYSKKDGFSGDKMNSLNHYAYGAVGQWMYERIAGLAPDPNQPGYKHFFVRPVISPQLDWAKAELRTVYGLAGSSWKKENGKLVLEVVVPPNTTATIEFPNDRESETVDAGTYRYVLDGDF